MFCICLSRRSYKRDLSLPISYHTTALQCNKNNNNNILYTGGTLLHHVFVHNARVAFLCSSSALQWMEQCSKRSKETQQTWVRCFLLRLSYSPASTLGIICFLLKSSKFHATFSPRIFALRCFALFRFTEQISSEYPGMYRAIRAVSSGKTREKKVLVSLPASFFSFRTVLFSPSNDHFCFSFSAVIPEHESSFTLFLRLVSVHLTKLLHSGSLQAWKQIKGR